jgi:seryl-tRNA synthetase
VFDIKWIRDNPDAFDKGLEARGIARGNEIKFSDELLARDDERRAHLAKLQDAQARRNTASKDIGKAMTQKDQATADKLKAEVAELKTFVQEGEDRERELNAGIEQELAVIPNIPLDDVPAGADENDNAQVRKVGKPTAFKFAPKQHFELGEQLGLMDFEAASKISGARFVVLKGALARLERAIGQFMLDLQTGEHGYEEVNPPLLVRNEATYGTAQLPKFQDDLFVTSRASIDTEVVFEQLMEESKAKAKQDLSDRPHAKEIDEGFLTARLESILDSLRDRFYEEFSAEKQEHLRLWLIPTAEVPLTNLVREQILTEDELPKRFTALTPCFRSEAGAAGKDTRGMIRQHQFTKCELVSITTPEQALNEHERMTKCAEEVLKRLELPYRVMLLCTGDMGFAAQKTYDLEVWLPGQDAYREISSCSVCGDFQARRMSARYRAADDKKTVRYVHTLNGSGLAVGRALIAVMENYQQADGSIAIPDVLRPYMGGIEKIPAAATD